MEFNKNMDLFIENLSKKDKKTLSQKTLKLVEEVGELSKVILPYDSAPGTNHRFVDRAKLLEEIVDIHLCNISILKSLDFTNDDFNEMLVQKTKKWSELQSREDEVNFPLPYEIHVTIKNENLDIEKFKSDCNDIQVKPIIIDLESTSNIIKDVMTSSKHFGDNKSSYMESLRIFNDLKDRGYNVIRNKIETVPWHMSAPKELKPNQKIDNDRYFESHIGVLISDSEKNRLSNLVQYINDEQLVDGFVKMSQNFFKKVDSGTYINMITYRSYSLGYNDFNKNVEFLKQKLITSGFKFEKVEVEFAIYDSNIHHDSKWLE